MTRPCPASRTWGRSSTRAATSRSCTSSPASIGPISASPAIFDRIVPRRNAYWVEGEEGKPDECGPGAWQVGFRYNYLDLNDKGIDGGILNDFTAGLNWFINPNMKFQWNYSVTLRQSPTGLSDGTIQGFGMRYAMDY